MKTIYACCIRFELYTIRCINFRQAHNKWYTQKHNLKEDRVCSRRLICGAKAYYKTDKQHPRLRQYTITTVSGLVTFLW